MKFLIQNTTSEDKFITRFGGYKMCIPKYDFIEFDSDDVLECNYWNNLINNPVEGLQVTTNLSRIKLLNKMKSCGKYGNVSNSTVNVPKKVEPVIDDVKEEKVETPVEDVNTVAEKVVTPIVDTPTITEPEVVNDIISDVTADVVTDEAIDDATTEDNVKEDTTTEEETPTFTKEELSTKTKGELLAILDTYGIEYKKNYSVSRLTNMILENCK
jgi:hypothetical protein